MGLLGRNGVGKSTTLKTIMGLVRPSEGHVTFEGREIAGWAPHRLPPLGIAWVPEDRRIFRLLTVLENLRTGLDRPGVTEPRQQALLDKVYAHFPVLARAARPGGGHAVGRRAADARHRAGHDARAQDHPARRAHRGPDAAHGLPDPRDHPACCTEEGVAILLVEQNVPLTLEVASRVYIMEKGAVRHHAPAAELRADHDVIQQYLGV